MGYEYFRSWSIELKYTEITAYIEVNIFLYNLQTFNLTPLLRFIEQIMQVPST